MLTDSSLIHQDNENATLKRFTKLLEAERSAQVHTTALNAVKKELDRIQLAHTTSHRPSDIREHFNAARHVIQLHDESQQKLRDLTADMGLSDLELPQQMTNIDREYLKKYTLARARQHGILIRLTKYQEEMSPIRSTQRRGRRLVSKIGKSHSCDGHSGSSHIMFQDTKQ